MVTLDKIWSMRMLGGSRLLFYDLAWISFSKVSNFACPMILLHSFGNTTECTAHSFCVILASFRILWVESSLISAIDSYDPWHQPAEKTLMRQRLTRLMKMEQGYHACRCLKQVKVGKGMRQWGPWTHPSQEQTRQTMRKCLWLCLLVFCI